MLTEGENKSEVARLLNQIEAEYHAGKHRLRRELVATRTQHAWYSTGAISTSSQQGIKSKVPS